MLRRRAPGTLAVVAEQRVPYEQTTIDWTRLRSYAQRVARETRAPRTSETVRREEWVDEVSSGFFGGRKVTKVRRWVDRSEPADYWLLDARSFRRLRRIDAQHRSTDVSTTRYCLRRDGQLVLRTESYDEFEGPRYGSSHYAEGTHEFREREFDEHAVMLFDFERGYRNTGEITTDGIHGRRLSHAKGVGLSLRLKRLLETGT